MTVCVATIFTYTVGSDICTGIVGASDRMVTSRGVVEFEPPSPKIVPLFPNEEFCPVVAMTAGDTPFQTEIILKTIEAIKERIDFSSGNWSVEEIALIYIECRKNLELRCSETAILAPFGLTHETFLQKQSTLAANFVAAITNKALGYESPDTASIICGIDKEGAQLYVINNNEISCLNKIGFAAIGIGEMHAESHFMLERHSYLSSGSEALLNTYVAKKKAEVAPGVGKETDMILIEGSKGYTLYEQIMGKLDDTIKIF